MQPNGGAGRAIIENNPFQNLDLDFKRKVDRTRIYEYVAASLLCTIKYNPSKITIQKCKINGDTLQYLAIVHNFVHHELLMSFLNFDLDLRPRKKNK